MADKKTAELTDFQQRLMFIMVINLINNSNLMMVVVNIDYDDIVNIVVVGSALGNGRTMRSTGASGQGAHPTGQFF